jgi:hypothetical protein
MSELWTSAFESAGSQLSAGWFWLFPLLFAIHDAEEAAYVWKEGSLHNSISYTTLNVTQTLVAISFELTIFMAAAAWATEPGASHLAIFTFAVLLGGYTAHGFVHQSRVARPPVHSWCRNSVAVGRVRRLVHLRETHRNRDPELDFGRSQFCSRHSCHVAFDPRCSLGRLDLRLRSAVLQRARRLLHVSSLIGASTLLRQ